MKEAKIHGLSAKETNEIIPSNTILLAYRGSIAHGMYVPKWHPDSIDDKDIMGVAFAPKSVYWGLESFEQKEKQKDEWDSVVYEIKKMFRLLLKQNPNVMSILWCHETHYIHIDPDFGQPIIDSREIFVSKAAYHSFIGYAYSQLKKMTHLAFEGYMGAKRKALVKQHGYDTKNAAHLIRLLRMGIEFLTDGELHVQREDATQLLSIKRGGWTLDKVKAEAESLFKLAHEAYVRSTLPPKPDWDKADLLLQGLVEKYLSK